MVKKTITHLGGNFYTSFINNCFLLIQAADTAEGMRVHFRVKPLGEGNIKDTYVDFDHAHIKEVESEHGDHWKDRVVAAAYMSSMILIDEVEIHRADTYYSTNDENYDYETPEEAMTELLDEEEHEDGATLTVYEEEFVNLDVSKLGPRDVFGDLLDKAYEEVGETIDYWEDRMTRKFKEDISREDFEKIMQENVTAAITRTLFDYDILPNVMCRRGRKTKELKYKLSLSENCEPTFTPVDLDESPK